MEAAAVGPRNKLKIVLVAKQDEEAKLKKEQEVLDGRLATARKEQNQIGKRSGWDVSSEMCLLFSSCGMHIGFHILSFLSGCANHSMQ